jgi:D-sedoheptulose 7-phosphate isomerase
MAADRDALRARLEAGVRASIAVKEQLLADLDPQLEVVEHLVEAIGNGGQLLLFGNGGSAADAQHLAAELVGRFYLERRALPGIALTTNTSTLTALGNDYGYDTVFARQIEAYGRAGDVAVGISTSGNAVNVIEGARAARAMGIWTVGLTGRDGGRLAAEVDLAIRVPSDDTPRIQEGHILLGHLWCQGLEAALFGDLAATAAT